MSPPMPSESYVEEDGLSLDSDDRERLEAEESPNAVVTSTPTAQKLGIFSVMCLIVNRMIGE
jgi:hypothetical protein